MVDIIALRPGYQYPPRLCQSRYRVQATDVSPEKKALTWSKKYLELCRRVITPVREGRTFVYLPSYLLKGENSHECIRGRAERMPADAYI